jgi:hypothetical protein
MSYENAASTKMLATRCAICSRKLRDAVSVEIGIGPVCRERHGYNIECDEATRARANKLVHECAVHLRDEDVRRAACAELRLLGFVILAERIEYRGKDAPTETDISIEEYTLPAANIRGRQYPERKGYLVRTPYKPAAVGAYRAIRGRVFIRQEKANFVPAEARRQLFELLKTYHAGQSAMGPKGAFVL